ncbi:pyridoxal phosphate-dependent aminotransferase [Amphritea balenae]|uniref:Aminotransferase n=1 Tax=Amphritea balenae TaxID=452629 RepID=A0A3P1SI43_9GAMM|nr:pyridoxal phosphate-dependent aminotransferase [Amphritea balenae]RRC96953.1 pyridoxal phosphate-dependent aminotransferase [Amphritea balenae]GGK85380.1 aminotransferase [Amphritea balenae]
MSNWSDRVAEIESFKVMDLLKRAKELDAMGHDVVHMCAGEPDFATPEPIAEAGIAAIRAGHTQYTPAAGIPQLREAIAGFYQQRYGLDIPAERVIVTAGASGALLMVFSTLANPGQTFMMADPGYPCNPRFLRLIEARGQLVPTDAGDNYQLTPELIEQNWQPNTAGVLLASPANPTGSVVPREQLELISQTVRANRGHLVVDELYHGLTYGFDATSVLEVDQDAFVLNSFSKYFGMTGWRLGWTVVPDAAVADIERLAQNLFISPPTIAQHAALAAFEPETLDILEARREAFRERRDLLVNGLRELGFGIPLTPEGAFYVYADASHLTDNTFDLCWELLEQDKIAVTPGVDFGEHRANQFIRFSYTTGIEQIEKMLTRLKYRFN